MQLNGPLYAARFFSGARIQVRSRLIYAHTVDGKHRRLRAAVTPAHRSMGAAKQPTPRRVAMNWARRSARAMMLSRSPPRTRRNRDGVVERAAAAACASGDIARLVRPGSSCRTARSISIGLLALPCGRAPVRSTWRSPPSAYTSVAVVTGSASSSLATPKSSSFTWPFLPPAATRAWNAVAAGFARCR